MADVAQRLFRGSTFGAVTKLDELTDRLRMQEDLEKARIEKELNEHYKGP